MSDYPIYVKDGREQYAATPADEVRLKYGGWRPKAQVEAEAERAREAKAEHVDDQPQTPAKPDPAAGKPRKTKTT